MVFLEIDEIIWLQQRVIANTGGASGVHDFGGLESAVNLPQMEMFGQPLYPTLAEKAAILGFALISNHPFMDGNKRIGQVAMDSFLIANGFEIDSPIDEQEQIILDVAAGKMEKETFTNWLKTRLKPINI